MQIVWLVPAGWIAHVFLHDVQDAHKQRQYKLLVGLVGVYIGLVGVADLLYIKPECFFVTPTKMCSGSGFGEEWELNRVDYRAWRGMRA